MKFKFFFFILVNLVVFQSFGQQKSYYNQTEFGIAFGNEVSSWWTGENENRVDFTMTTFHGVQFSRHHAVGFSVGYDQYQSISVVPIALGWRGFLGNENKAQLIGGLDFGGGLTFLERKEVTEWDESWYKGGVMVSPSLGVKFPGKKGKTALTMTVAYKRQELGFITGFFEQNPTRRPLGGTDLPPGYSSITETEFLFHSLIARVGLSF